MKLIIKAEDINGNIYSALTFGEANAFGKYPFAITFTKYGQDWDITLNKGNTVEGPNELGITGEQVVALGAALVMSGMVALPEEEGKDGQA